MSIYTEIGPDTSTGKDAYLKYISDWKANYRALVSAIRELKKARKQYVWKYSMAPDGRSKIRTIVGRNPLHGKNNPYTLAVYRCDAFNLLEWRKDAKTNACARSLAEKQARLAKEAI